MKTILLFQTLALVGALGFSSCRKDKEADETGFTAEQQVAQDQNQADTETEDVSAMQDDLMAANESKLFARMATSDTIYRFRFDSCAQVTLIPKGNNATGKITVDYGTGCIGRDGRSRRGKVEWTFTDRIRKPGSVVTTRFIDYGIMPRNGSSWIMVDNSSTKITTNVGSSEPVPRNALFQIRRDVAMKLIFPDGRSFSWVGTKNLEWNLGELGYRWDNVYTLKAGSSLSGIDRQNRNYTLTVDSDVVRKASCALEGIYKPVSGVVTITHNSRTKVVDFGTGTCDNTVTITINGSRTRTRW